MSQEGPIDRSDDRLPDLLLALHRAPLSAAGWSKAVRRIAEALGGAKAALHVLDPARGCGLLVARSSGEGGGDAVTEAECHRLQALLDRRRRHAGMGRDQETASLIPAAEMDRCRRLGEIGHGPGAPWSAGAFVRLGAGASALLTVIHPNGAPSDEARVEGALACLAPHLQLALATHRRLQSAETLAATLEDGLDAWPLGVILLGHDGSVLLANAAAERINRANDGFGFTGRGLRWGAAGRRHPQDRRGPDAGRIGLLAEGRAAVGATDLLQAGRIGALDGGSAAVGATDLLAAERIRVLAEGSAAAGATDLLDAGRIGVLAEGSAAAGATFLVERPSGRAAYQVRVAPAAIASVPGSQDPLVAGSPRAVVFVADPDAEPAGVEPFLCRTWGLTAAEARLGRRLLAGADLRDAGNALGIRYETARCHLKAIFDKTGAARQSGLIRLLLRGVAGLVDDGSITAAPAASAAVAAAGRRARA